MKNNIFGGEKIHWDDIRSLNQCATWPETDNDNLSGKFLHRKNSLKILVSAVRLFKGLSHEMDLAFVDMYG